MPQHLEPCLGAQISADCVDQSFHLPPQTSPVPSSLLPHRTALIGSPPPAPTSDGLTESNTGKKQEAQVRQSCQELPVQCGSDWIIHEMTTRARQDGTSKATFCKSLLLTLSCFHQDFWGKYTGLEYRSSPPNVMQSGDCPGYKNRRKRGLPWEVGAQPWVIIIHQATVQVCRSTDTRLRQTLWWRENGCFHRSGTPAFPRTATRRSTLPSQNLLNRAPSSVDGFWLCVAADSL